MRENAFVCLPVFIDPVNFKHLVEIGTTWGLNRFMEAERSWNGAGWHKIETKCYLGNSLFDISSISIFFLIRD